MIAWCEKNSYIALAAMIMLITFYCQKNGNLVNRSSLNKLLYFADLICYDATHQTISGVAYKKFDYGPVPLKIRDIRDFLLSSDFLTEEIVNNFGYPRYIYRTSDIVIMSEVKKILHPRELDILIFVADNIGTMSTTTLSRLVYQSDPWISTDWADTIDFW